MMPSSRPTALLLVLLFLGLTALCGCEQKGPITQLSQLEKGLFAVPTGTVADQLVLSRMPGARFVYFNSVLDAALAVKAGKADAVAYDEPILRNIAAKTGGLALLEQPITIDQYGFAVSQDNLALKQAIDAELAALRADGRYDDLLRHWLPATGSPAPMPDIALPRGQGSLRLGTAAVTEPFSFVGEAGAIVGFDIELARRVALRLGKDLEIVNLEFGALIPALLAGKVDLIGACITITDERSRKVLFSEPYYRGGISALVRQP